MFSVSQAARRLGVCPKTIRRWHATGPLLKKMRHLAAVWRKIRRLDREIARQVASRTVWWCEEHEVRTLVFESLKNYTPPAGKRGLSWALSTNLWSKIWGTIVYMRQQLGHKYGGVWSVNPRWTSQTCSACGERGYRIEWPGAREERRVLLLSAL
ncbi:MAG: hypothetical protein ACTSXS_05585 [Candidatus Thorarchaeota archaeon]